MFVRSETDKRRVIIIDFQHLAYKYAYGGATRLSTPIDINGVLTNVDTTIPAYTIKQIHRLSCGGYYPTVVCFDAQGSTKSRKAYLLKYKNEHTGDADVVGTLSEYKEGRQSSDSRFYEGINMTMNLLHNGGVCVLKAESYEADDLVKAAVDKAKEQYPNLPIDIITGDQDMLPLVDEQVSVFITSKKTTWAESKDLEKRGYVQVTPRNYQEIVEGMSEFAKLTVPYNSSLLKKLLRGKKADKIDPFKGITPLKYNNIVSDIIGLGYDMDKLFRYCPPTRTICYRGTEEPIPEELIESTPREQKMVKYGEPPALTKICNVLRECSTVQSFDVDSLIEHVRFVYNYVNLNGHFTGLADGLNRAPAVLKNDIKGYDSGVLQQEVWKLRITLPY